MPRYRIEEVAHEMSRRSLVLTVKLDELQQAQSLASRLATTPRTVLRIYSMDGELLTTRKKGEWHEQV